MEHILFKIIISLILSIIIVLALFLLILLIKKSYNLKLELKKIKFKIVIIIPITFIFLIIISILINFPIDRYFFKYSTLEEGFEYYYQYETILNVISNDEYYFITSVNNNIFTNHTAHKNKDKWTYYLDIYNVKREESVCIYIYKIPNSNVYFIRVIDTSLKNNKLNIKDDIASTFKEIKLPIKGHEGDYFDYTYVTSVKLNKEEAKNYYIYVNNKKIKVFNNFKTIRE